MINNVQIEGFIYDDVKEFTYNSGKKGYSGVIASYNQESYERGNLPKFYTRINFRCSEPLFNQISGWKGKRVLLTGKIQNTKQELYVFVNYASYCPVQSENSLYKPAVKEETPEVIGDSVDNCPDAAVSDDEIPELTDADLPF